LNDAMSAFGRLLRRAGAAEPCGAHVLEAAAVHALAGAEAVSDVVGPRAELPPHHVAHVPGLLAVLVGRDWAQAAAATRAARGAPV